MGTVIRVNSISYIPDIGGVLRLGLVTLAGFGLAAPAAHAACETRFSRVAMAMSSQVPPEAAGRLHMVRVAPAATPTPKRRPAAVRSASRPRPAAHRVRHAGVRAPQGRRAAARRVATAAAPAPAEMPRPPAFAAAYTAPAPVAAPAFALIKITTCDTGGPSVVPLIPMPASASPPPAGQTPIGMPPSWLDEGPVLVGGYGPGSGPGPGLPPGGPGIFLPPLGPGGPMGAVPEPGAWMLMILGFGAVGWRLRQRPGRERLAHPGVEVLPTRKDIP